MTWIIGNSGATIILSAVACTVLLCMYSFHWGVLRKTFKSNPRLNDENQLSQWIYPTPMIYTYIRCSYFDWILHHWYAVHILFCWIRSQTRKFYRTHETVWCSSDIYVDEWYLCSSQLFMCIIGIQCTTWRACVRLFTKYFYVHHGHSCVPNFFHVYQMTFYYF